VEFKKFEIIALPFAQSEATATFEEYALDETKAFEQFQTRYPLYRVKSVTEQ
jgi:hypothetical protein